MWTMWIGLAAAAGEPMNVVSLDAMGFSGFVGRHAGDFGLLYERTLAGPHALVLQGGYAHTHGPPAHANVGSARLGYRLHLASGAVVPFVGALVGARVVGGEHEPVEGEPPTATWSARGATGSVHLGSRVAVAGPVVLGSRVGVALQAWDFPGCEGAPCEAARRLLAASPVGVDAELSVGVAF